MEDLLEKHKDNSTVNSIYFPVELNRAKFLIRGRLSFNMM